MPRKLDVLVYGVLPMLALTLVACSSEIAPDEMADGWQTTSPDAVGLDSEKLAEAVELVKDGTYPNVHSILVVKDGRLVFEQYFDGYTWDFNGDEFKGELTANGPDTLHNQASVTKSFTSTLVGIAIDQGFIEDVDEKLFDYFPAYSHLADEGKSSITLEHLLTMTVGLEWNGIEVPIDSRDPANDILQLFQVGDPIEYILAKPLVTEPGADWYYNGGATVLLGEILRKASGQRIDAFAEEYLFGPLGITDYEWYFINPDLVFSAGNLRLRPRDMAKLGQLYLDRGFWEGERLVSEQWVRRAVEAHATHLWGEGYGYQWWTESLTSNSHQYGIYFASGWGGQRIIVVPELEMVIVLTAGNYTQADPALEIIENHILPALSE